MSKQTTYLKAVDWLHNQRILCNDIVNKDPSVFDNMRFDLACDLCKTIDIENINK